MKRQPKHIQMIESLGYSQQKLDEAREWFARHGIQIGWSDRRREWSMMAFGRDDGPTAVILWQGAMGLANSLDNREETVRQFEANGAKVTPLPWVTP